MNGQSGKEKLREALLRLEEDEIRSETEEMLSYSRALLARGKRRKKLSRIAAAAVAVIMFGSFSLGVAAKEPMAKWFSEAYETFTSFFVDQAYTGEAQKTVYTLGVVPDGYVRQESVISGGVIHSVWRNIEGDEIVLMQLPLESHVFLDTLDAMTETAQMAGFSVLKTEKDGVMKFLWNTEDAIFCLVCEARFSDDFASRMIGSLRRK